MRDDVVVFQRNCPHRRANRQNGDDSSGYAYIASDGFQWLGCGVLSSEDDLGCFERKPLSKVSNAEAKTHGTAGVEDRNYRFQVE